MKDFLFSYYDISYKTDLGLTERLSQALQKLAHLLARLKATSPIRKHLEYECAAYDWLISKAWILAISKSFINQSLLLCLRHAKALTEEKELRTHTLATDWDGLWLLFFACLVPFFLLLLRWIDSALNHTVV